MQVRITVNDRTHFASTGAMHLPTLHEVRRGSAASADTVAPAPYFELVAEEAGGKGCGTQRSCIVRVSPEELAMVLTELAYQQRLDFVHGMTWSALQALGQQVLHALAEHARH